VVETGNRIEQLLREAPPTRDEYPELTDSRYKLRDDDGDGPAVG
jgi:hypothetical protein